MLLHHQRGDPDAGGAVGRAVACDARVTRRPARVLFLAWIGSSRHGLCQAFVAGLVLLVPPAQLCCLPLELGEEPGVRGRRELEQEQGVANLRQGDDRARSECDHAPVDDVEADGHRQAQRGY